MAVVGGSQEIADAAAAAMFAEDRNAHAMGMIVTTVAPGAATVEMTVAPSMANGLDVCHGGVIFALSAGPGSGPDGVVAVFHGRTKKVADSGPVST